MNKIEEEKNLNDHIKSLDKNIDHNIKEIKKYDENIRNDEFLKKIVKAIPLLTLMISLISMMAIASSFLTIIECSLIITIIIGIPMIPLNMHLNNCIFEEEEKINKCQKVIDDLSNSRDKMKRQINNLENRRIHIDNNVKEIINNPQKSKHKVLIKRK